MIDETKNILDIFEKYARTFEALKPSRVLPFYHYPAMLVSPQKAVAIKNWLEGFVAFTVVMSELKRRCYDHGKTPSLSVNQLSHNLAIVSGVVIRYKKDGKELERFGLAYTMRKVNDDWKIIVGVLHDISVENAA